MTGVMVIQRRELCAQCPDDAETAECRPRITATFLRPYLTGRLDSWRCTSGFSSGGLQVLFVDRRPPLQPLHAMDPGEIHCERGGERLELLDGRIEQRREECAFLAMLPVEPDVFHAVVRIDAVDRPDVTLHVRMPARSIQGLVHDRARHFLLQLQVDLLNQALALNRIDDR